MQVQPVTRHKVAIVGASGYTGVELVRILANHPYMKIASLVGDSSAGQQYAAIHPAFQFLDLPQISSFGDFDPEAHELTFCALPHGASQRIVSAIANRTRVVDLSADFRLRSVEQYEIWYGRKHQAAELQAKACYGLTEFYRTEIAGSRLVACTGCNSATGLFALLPLVQARVIDLDRITIDLKTGVSGAGRSARVAMLHAEISEGCRPYSVSRHRHLAEFDQELSIAADEPVRVVFTPHLVPQNRGILATVYVIGDASQIHRTLARRYADERFVSVLPLGDIPGTRDVRGSNRVHLGVAADRNPGVVKVFSVLDNLTKGSSGQAVQNANLMLGLDEDAGLGMLPLLP